MATPQGKVGEPHETLGAVLLAVPRALEHLARNGRLGPRTVLDQLLGTAAVQRLADVEPTQWYPIGWLLEMTDALEPRVGAFGLRRVGRILFELSHAAEVRQRVHCGLEIARGIDAMYNHANRGDGIGGWTLRNASDSSASLEKTTPHHCAMEEGILTEAMRTVGCRVIVSQPTCVRRGDDRCRFEIDCLAGPWAHEHGELHADTLAVARR